MGVINTDILSRTVSKLSQIIVQILNTLRFWATHWGLRRNVHCSSYSEAHWKARSGHPVSDNWTFSLGVISCWGAMSEYRLKIGVFALTGWAWSKISGRRGRPPNNYSSLHKTNINDLSHGIKIWAELSSILLQSTNLTDRRTDGQTDRQTYRQTDSFLVARPR